MYGVRQQGPLMVFDEFWPGQPSHYPTMSEELLPRGLAISPIRTLDLMGIYVLSSATRMLPNKQLQNFSGIQ